MLERLELRLLLMLTLDLLWLRVQSGYEIACSLCLSLISGLTRICIVIFVCSLSLANLLIDFILDLLKLLLRLLIIVSQDHEDFARMLQFLRIIVGFLLEPHGFCLIKAVASLYKFIVRFVHLVYINDCSYKDR